MAIADHPDTATSERIQSLTRPGEEVLLTVASDVASTGGYGRHWLVVTSQWPARRTP
jgi:hypothetical protein